MAKIKHAEIYHAKKKERENFPIYGISLNDNSLGYEQFLRPVDVTQSPNVQDTFQPMSDFIGYNAVARSVGITHPAHTTQRAGVYI